MLLHNPPPPLPPPPPPPPRGERMGGGWKRRSGKNIPYLLHEYVSQCEVFFVDGEYGRVRHLQVLGDGNSAAELA